jgi:type VI secretion system protein ImpC
MNPGRTSIDADVTLEKKTDRLPVELEEDPPFHGLVIGEFSGVGAEKGNLKAHSIDRDDFEDVLRRIRPRVSIAADNDTGISIEFRELDDFHPDNLFKSLAVFDELRDLRRRLLQENTYRSAAKEVRGWFDEGEGDKAIGAGQDVGADVKGDEVVIEGGGGLLDDVLGSRSRSATAYKPKKSAHLKDFVKKVSEPFVIRVDENEQAKLLEHIDRAAGNMMRAIVQDKGFKKLEANWRGLYFMCRRIETAADLKLFVVDIDKERFLSELKEGESEEKGIVEIWAHGVPENNNEPWAFVAGAFDFGLSIDDIAGLIRVSGIAGISNVPFVSHVRPGMLGIESFAGNEDYRTWDTKSDTEEGKLWTALRASENADSIGLIVPRLMARLPYGVDTEPTEGFVFEEFDDEFGHDDYLWMNPVFGFAVMLASSFRSNGWEIGGRYDLDLTGLPVHVFDDGRTPSAEIDMTDGAMGVLLEQGLMAYAAFRDTDRVRLGGVQSVKYPLKSLAGRWN